MNTLKSLTLGLALLSASLTGLPALAGDLNLSEGVAIRGYDPVAYFTDKRPVPGKPTITYRYHGGLYHFATQAHRDEFARDPAHYAPQYGGFCAFGASQGHKAPIDPAAFTVVGDRLYLNYNRAVMKTWRQDIPGYNRQADRQWSTVRLQPDP